MTLPFSVREGINIFLGGFVPTENLRFREESLSFKVTRRRSHHESWTGDLAAHHGCLWFLFP